MKKHWLSFAAIALLATPVVAGSAAATEEMANMPASEAPQAMEPAAPADASEEMDMANGHVARAAFTTGIANREPQDEVYRLRNDSSKIFFFTDLRDLQGQTVTHVWEREGNVMASVPFAVSAPRWRVYSSKNLDPNWTGDWGVKVVDESGNVLHSQNFTYVPSAAQKEEPAQAPASLPME